MSDDVTQALEFVERLACFPNPPDYAVTLAAEVRRLQALVELADDAIGVAWKYTDDRRLLEAIDLYRRAR